MKSSGELTGTEVHGFEMQDKGDGHYNRADYNVWLMREGSLSKLIKEGGRYPLVINAVSMDGKILMYLVSGVALVYGEQVGDRLYHEIVYWNGRRELYDYGILRIGHEVFYRGVQYYNGFTRVCRNVRTVNEAGECSASPPPPPADGVACSPGVGFKGAYRNGACVKTGCADVGRTLNASGVCAFDNEGAPCGTQDGFVSKYRAGQCVKTLDCAAGYWEAHPGVCQPECPPGQEKWKGKCVTACKPPKWRHPLFGDCLCPSGTALLKDECVEPCPKGQVYAKQEPYQCVKEYDRCGFDAATKKILTYRYDGWCGVTNPECVAGYRYVDATGRCVANNA
jgi:hypothetical protein